MMAVNGTHTTDDNMEKVVRMQLDLIAFAFASDRARTATLQVGGCNDHTKYMVNGVQAPPFHFISHRVMSDGGSGTAIPNAVQLHHQIDRIHARFFKHFLDRLAAYPLARGRHPAGHQREPVHQLGRRRAPPQRQQRPSHHRRRRGRLPQDRDPPALSGFTNRVLNTIITAAGGRKPNGDPVDNFGDPNTPGLIAEAVAAP